jgi:hypothetical protein
MTSPILAALLASRSKDVILDDLLVKAHAAGLRARGWDSKRIGRVMLEIEAQTVEAWEKARVAIARGGYLGDDVNGPFGAWLDLVALGWFQELRGEALTCEGRMVLTEFADDSLHVIEPGALTAVFGPELANPLRYTNVDGGTLPKGGTLALTFRSESSGAAYNVPPGAVSFLNTPIQGVSIANPADPVSGTWITRAGADPESDASLRAKCRDKWGSLGAAGNLAAVRYRIRKAAELFALSISRFRVRDDNPNGPGSVDVYLANPAGPASAAEVKAVRGYLASLKALGTGPLRCFPATLLKVPLVASLRNATNPNALPEAIQRLVALQSDYPLGEPLYRARLIDELVDVPSGTIDARLVSPAKDVLPARTDAIVLEPVLTLL